MAATQEPARVSAHRLLESGVIKSDDSPFTPTPVSDERRLLTADATSQTIRQPSRGLVAFIVGHGLVAFGVLIALLIATPPHIAAADATTETQANTIVVFVYTLGAMICCGILGGTLFDLRGVIKHSVENDFDPFHSLSYKLRPLAGGICALICFFMLLAGALGFSGTHDISNAGWTSFDGRTAFLAMALLAGYSSHVFMLKLKDIADAAFSPKGASHEPTEPQNTQEPAIPLASPTPTPE